MKPLLRQLTAVLFVGGALSLAAAPTTEVPLLNLGLANFAVDTSVTNAGYSQTADSLLFAPSAALGDTLGGLIVAEAQDWSLFSTFRLRMTLLGGPNPNLPFSVEFIRILNEFEIESIRFTGTTVGLADGPSLISLGYAGGSRSALSSVDGLQFTWDGNANSLNIAVSDVVAVAAPEEGLFTVRAPGGVYFITSDGSEPGNLGAQVSSGTSGWVQLSDLNAKTGITPIDTQEVLRKVAELPVTAWRYKHNPERPYIGPMAQDFHETFGLGSDDRHISTLDTDGVALAALKGLIEELQERKDRSAAQARRLHELEAELGRLQKLVQNLPPAE